MGLKNPFRRSSAQREPGNGLHDVIRPWWAWGPLGLIWYGGHHDSGTMHHPGDAGHFNHNIDHGGGFGGFDGGAGAGGGV